MIASIKKNQDFLVKNLEYYEKKFNFDPIKNKNKPKPLGLQKIEKLKSSFSTNLPGMTINGRELN